MRTSGSKDLSQELMVVSGFSIEVMADSVEVNELNRELAVVGLFCNGLVEDVWTLGMVVGDKLGVVDLVSRVIDTVGGML